jgi:hypothetical protein
MSLFRKRTSRKPEEEQYTEPDSSSPFASFEAAWRAEDEAENERQSDRLADPGLSLAPLRSVFSRGRLTLLLAIAVIAGLIWAVTLGPLAPVISDLKNLPQRVLALIPSPATATPTSIPPTPLPTHTPIKLPPTFTPEPSLTPAIEPSLAPVPAVVPENTPTLAPTVTLTPEVSDCTPSESVTLDDVGKIMCVTGKVIQTIERSTSFSILVGTRTDSFFFVSYERTYNLNKGTCIFATGEIVKLGKNPIMLIGYLAPLELCNP